MTLVEGFSISHENYLPRVERGGGTRYVKRAWWIIRWWYLRKEENQTILYYFPSAYVLECSLCYSIISYNISANFFRTSKKSPFCICIARQYKWVKSLQFFDFFVKKISLIEEEKDRVYSSEKVVYFFQIILHTLIIWGSRVWSSIDNGDPPLK